MNPIIWKGYKEPLVQDDLFNLPRKINVDENVVKFQTEWKSYLTKNKIKFSSKKNRKRAKLWIPLIRTVGWRFLLANFLAFIHYNVTFAGPQVTDCISLPVKASLI